SLTTTTTSTIITTFPTTCTHIITIPLSLLPSLPALLFIPPVDHRYEVGESSTAAPRPTGGHRADYGFIGTVDAEVRQ
ncbi:hypothetical protein Tco_0372543, partial [Tanacetum coccineum]